MAQVSTIIKGDPDNIATQLSSLAATNDIQQVRKTFSAGEYIVIYDDSAGSGQSAEVVKGDPSTIVGLINTLTIGATKIVVSETFSASSYIVVYD